MMSAGVVELISALKSSNSTTTMWSIHTLEYTDNICGKLRYSFCLLSKIIKLSVGLVLISATWEKNLITFSPYTKLTLFHIVLYVILKI